MLKSNLTYLCSRSSETNILICKIYLDVVFEISDSSFKMNFGFQNWNFNIGRVEIVAVEGQSVKCNLFSFLKIQTFSFYAYHFVTSIILMLEQKVRVELKWIITCFPSWTVSFGFFRMTVSFFNAISNLVTYLVLTFLRQILIWNRWLKFLNKHP